MTKKARFLLVFLSLTLGVTAQDFPVKEWLVANQNKPLIFYISGDGGLNKFSNELCGSLNEKGFEVDALDAKTYFWSKKTPEQTTGDVSDFLTKKLSGRKNRQVILIGYSFGADVLPFVLNRLPQSIHNEVLVAILMASSGSTDFEIHWSGMFGIGKKRSMDVLTTVNKLSGYKFLILNSSDEQGLDPKKITVKHFFEVLPGGHHFDGDIDEIVKVILKYIEG